MPTIDGSFSVDAPREKVWAFLLDLPHLAPCIPGCDNIEMTGEESFKGTVRVRVGPISARFAGNATITERRPPEHIAARLEGKDGGTASMLKVRASLDLAEPDVGQTEVSYHADVEVLGKLGGYGWSLMRRKAEETLAAFGEAVRQQLAS